MPERAEIKNAQPLTRQCARPEGFQTSEFLLQHGFIDRIVPRKDLRTEVAGIIDYCEH